jgi:hypothetical protein
MHKYHLALLILLLSCLPAFAEIPKPGDLKDGEEYQIQQRHEWFYSTRRGDVDRPIGQLRLQAIQYTRQQMEIQRKARGGKMPNALWISRGPSSSDFGGWTFGRVAGRVIALAKDWTNNILYTGAASGGLWKSTDDGLSWTSLFDEAGTTTVGEIAIDPNNPQILWVGTGENSMWCEDYFGIGLLRSTDGGSTWELRNGSGANTLENISAFASVVVDPDDSNHLVVGGAYRDCSNGNYYSAGIYSTTDSGANWTKRMSGVVTEVVQDPTDHQIFWAGVDGNGVHKSTDGGNTWTKQTSVTTSGRVEVAVSPSSHLYVYALSENSFWRTTNGGTSWTQMSSGSNACDGQCWYNMVIRVHSTQPNTVYRGTIHIFKSTSGGSTWTDLSGPWGSTQKVHQDTHEFVVSPTDGNILYVGCDGGVWKTVNGGTSFTNLNANLNITQFYAVANHPTDDGIIAGGAQDNSSLARNGDDLWELQEVTGDGFVCAINPTNTNYAYLTSYPWGPYPSVYRSTSGVFGYFTVITGSGSGIIANDRINWVTPYLLDPNSPNVLYLGTHRVYKSTDYGTSWTAVSGDTTGGSGSLLSLEVNRNASNVVYSGSESGRIWRSTNSGGSWTDISTGLPGKSINDIAGDPIDTARAYAVVGGFNTSHFYTYDGTGAWTAAGAGLPNVPANTVIMMESGDIYVGNDVGVYKSADGGANFVPYMDGLPQGVVVTDLKYTPATYILTAGTYGRGAWQVPLEGCGMIHVLPASLPDGTPGTAYSQTLSAIGGTTPYTFDVTSGSLPPGLSLNTSTGLLSGVPTTLGNYSFDVTATDSTGCAGTGSYLIRICTVIGLSPATLQDGTVGVAYSQTVSGSGGTPPYSYAVASGMLPGGLSLNPTTGEISGTPSAGGSFDFVVRATDDLGCSGTQAYAIFICGSITMTPASLPNGTVGTYYVQVIAASGGTSPYTYALTSGSLPAGLSLSTTGSIHGVPTTPQAVTFDVTATDSKACSGTKSYLMAICGSIMISPGSLPSGTVGDAYSEQISADGGNAPYAYSVMSGSLPAGLSLDPTTGHIGGTPTVAVTADFVVRVEDAYGCLATRSYSIMITSGCLFCDDFEDGLLSPSWSYLKPSWTEADGALIGQPTTKKAIAIASPVFAGCSACKLMTVVQSAGGPYNKLFVLGWYQDKRNAVELVIKQESGRWVLRQRSGGTIVAKKAWSLPVLPDTDYQVEITFATGDLTLKVDGTELGSIHASGTPFGTVGYRVLNTTGRFNSVSIDAN